MDNGSMTWGQGVAQCLSRMCTAQANLSAAQIYEYTNKYPNTGKRKSAENITNNYLK